ncbi:MAG: hypothetical protein RL700_1661 [Pseudomonadota bacterium]
MPRQFSDKSLKYKVALASGLLSTGLAFSQADTAPVAAPSSTFNPNKAGSFHEAGPKWAELNAEQKLILQPLQNLWPTLEENRKRKWLAIAKNFPTLSPQAQATAQERMREWAALTPAQRYQARLHFAQAQQWSTDEKLAKWEAYQALNEEEKNKLSQGKPAWSKGAAMVARPIAPEKLTATPVTKKEGQEKPPRIETAQAQVDPYTLLPIKKRPSSDKP